LPKRTKDEIFLALVTDAVAGAYVVPGLQRVGPDAPKTLDELKRLMDAAGLLVDAQPL
jgi:hypothetical protein